MLLIVLERLLTSRNVSETTKLRIIKCYIWATSLYGSETWTLTEQIIKKLQAFEMWVYRKILRISWKDKKTNEEVLNMLQIKLHVIPAIQKRKTVYFGHINQKR